MPQRTLQRRIAWLVLAMYLAAGAVVQLAHDCHGPAGHEADRSAAESPDAGHGKVASQVVAPDDDCAACRLLGQLSHGFVPPAPLDGSALDAPLATLTPPSVPGGILLAPHSRGPPQVA